MFYRLTCAHRLTSFGAPNARSCVTLACGEVDEISVEKLWLQRPVDDDSTTRGVTGIRFVHDENRFVKKKFKAAPTTQAEVPPLRSIKAF